VHTLAAALLLGVACRTVPSAPAEVPAVLVAPGPQARAALAEAVRSALGGVPVTLGDEALTRSSTLVVERVRLRDASGLPVNGRDLGFPDRFHLVKRGHACVLVHERTARRVELAGAECAPGSR